MEWEGDVKHTKEKLHVGKHLSCFIRNEQGEIVADCREQYTHRLVACWNACEGIKTEDLERGAKNEC